MQQFEYQKTNNLSFAPVKLNRLDSEYPMKQLYQQQSRDVLRQYEKIPTNVFDTSHDASVYVANLIRDGIKKKNAQGQTFVLGCATGSTPLSIYAELKRMHKEEGLSFKNVVTFNLDEYYPMKKESLQSYCNFMHTIFFKSIDIPPENINIPNGEIPFSEIEDWCEQYEKKIQKFGGIDFQILGIGKTGHIGFNEPGSSIESTTRLIYLDRVTLIDAASDFFGLENVPKKAITMGIKSILSAKKVAIMAFSETKAIIVKKAIQGEITDEIPASYLQHHPDVEFCLDRPAADKLTRLKCPWTIKGIHKAVDIQYNKFLIHKAVIWLAIHLEKPISKLVELDYEMNNLYQLMEQVNFDIKGTNQMVIQSLSSKITEYPAGKDQPKKKILIFSPHPDDDVICMAGTMRKLIEQGHEVSVAYQTSGNIGVFDHDAIRFAKFGQLLMKAFNFAGQEDAFKLEENVKKFINQKFSGQVDSKEILTIKGIIRKTEAISAAVSTGCKEENCHFLDLPFYQTGTIKKKVITEEDVKIVYELIQNIQPDIVFAAGDLTDPHGTHRTCLVAIVKALEKAEKEMTEWRNKCDVYLYRGAWQEWEIERVSLAVPLNPDEVYLKRQSIFKHQSQKDRALFPGYDSREFWQRSEDRNKETAKMYDKLGVAEYEAMEVFVNLKEIKHLIKI